MVRPQALDEDVVSPGAFPIHADLDLILEQQAGEGDAGELGALIGVEDLRLAISGKSLLDRLQTELRFQCNRSPAAYAYGRQPRKDGGEQRRSTTARHLSALRDKAQNLNEERLPIGTSASGRQPIIGSDGNSAMPKLFPPPSPSARPSPFSNAKLNVKTRGTRSDEAGDAAQLHTLNAHLPQRAASPRRQKPLRSQRPADAEEDRSPSRKSWLPIFSTYAN